ncbi:hypothetical protein ABEX53_31615 [Bacillus toyonensis]|uniref:hypothetical protein n=1 Tax=Bacillus toyonensis TaxID=155322 RepID=UPI000B4365AF|nr:hypothetical protein [Bacillus toyonensis]MED3540638.1 hypothetical protein [Bacillus toyonensis]OTW84948.1 hypothetical protein BK702_15745 [Bacillus thuringiensis serovar cameroun]
MKRYRVEFTETKSYEAFVEAPGADKAIDKVRNGLVEEEELIEKDVIIDGMYLQNKSSQQKLTARYKEEEKYWIGK